MRSAAVMGLEPAIVSLLAAGCRADDPSVVGVPRPGRNNATAPAPSMKGQSDRIGVLPAKGRATRLRCVHQPDLGWPYGTGEQGGSQGQERPVCETFLQGIAERHSTADALRRRVITTACCISSSQRLHSGSEESREPRSCRPSPAWVGYGPVRQATPGGMSRETI